ncbi:hypothetical protein KKI24_17400, partial [bacterium]|nr:hypothetical protein [bacterium]
MEHDSTPDMSSMAGLNNRLTTAAKAMEIVKSGDRIFVGTACATPRTLIRALEEETQYLYDVQLFHFLTDGAIPNWEEKPKTRFKHKVFFVGADTREAVKEGMADYIPISL